MRRGSRDTDQNKRPLRFRYPVKIGGAGFSSRIGGKEWRVKVVRKDDNRFTIHITSIRPKHLTCDVIHRNVVPLCLRFKIRVGLLFYFILSFDVKTQILKTRGCKSGVKLLPPGLSYLCCLMCDSISH